MEAVQKKAVKMVAGLAGTSYEERCKELGLETLEKMRWNQDMTQTFKIINRIDKLSPSKLFSFRQETVHTRRADDLLHLRQKRARLDVRKKGFAARVVDGWNGIDYKQKSGSIGRFKNKLKKQTTMIGGEPTEAHDERG